jgi:hypothetical protein
MLTNDRARIVDTFDDAAKDRFVAVATQRMPRWQLADTYRVGRLTKLNLTTSAGIRWSNASLEAADPTRD